MRKLRRDNKRRNLYSKLEFIRLILKLIIKDTSLSLQIRQRAKVQLTLLPHDSTISRIRNYCPITGRGRANLPLSNKKGDASRISRMIFKSHASKGLIPGVRRNIA